MLTAAAAAPAGYSTAHIPGTEISNVQSYRQRVGKRNGVKVRTKEEKRESRRPGRLKEGIGPTGRIKVETQTKNLSIMSLHTANIAWQPNDLSLFTYLLEQKGMWR